MSFQGEADVRHYKKKYYNDVHILHTDRLPMAPTADLSIWCSAYRINDTHSSRNGSRHPQAARLLGGVLDMSPSIFLKVCSLTYLYTAYSLHFSLFCSKKSIRTQGYNCRFWWSYQDWWTDLFAERYLVPLHTSTPSVGRTEIHDERVVSLPVFLYSAIYLCCCPPSTSTPVLRTGLSLKHLMNSN